MEARTRTALLLSPHFDDVAFSCGGIAAGLAHAGWRVLVVTAFTRSVHPTAGFALECQRDKGLADDIDYMALRREEDRAACTALGAEPVLLDLPEAPNRGYRSVAALFAPPREDDGVAGPLVDLLTQLMSGEHPALVLAPQGCGGHVDHVRLIDAVLEMRLQFPVVFGFYRDTPYVIRNPSALPDPRVAAWARHDVMVPISEASCLGKQDAVACYGSQLGFQFGGVAPARDALDELGRREAGGRGHAERLRTPDRDALEALLA